MSTALETIAAREAGLQVLGISLVTNLAAGISGEPLNHQEVLPAGREAAPRLRQLLAAWVAHDLDHVVQISRVLARQYSEEVGPWRAFLRIISGEQG